MPRKTSAPSPAYADPDLAGPATDEPVIADAPDPVTAGRAFAVTLVSAPNLAAQLGLIAQRLASGTRRNGVVPAELADIPKAALKKLADVLDLYADALPTIPTYAELAPEPVEPDLWANLQDRLDGHTDAAAYLADPDPGAQYAGPTDPDPSHHYVIPMDQADPELEHSVADQLGNSPALVGQPYPLKYGPTDDERAPAPVVTIGLPFPTRRAAPVAPSELDPSSVNPTPLSWPNHDSVSSVQTFAQCGWRYYAEYGRGLRNVGPPAWWNVGGTAAHAAIEGWERVRAQGAGSPSADDTAKVFSEQLALERDQLAHLSGISPDQWRAANRRYPEDGKWWADHGPGMVASYVDAQEGRGFEPVIVGDVLGLELAGTVLVGPMSRPFEVRIDAVLGNATTGEVRVRDYKYGRPPEPGGLQLPAYRYALAFLADGAFDMRPDPGLPGAGWTGEYWLGRKGEASEPVALPFELGMNRVISAVATLDAARRAHVMMPNPGTFCGSCPLKPICPAHTKNGRSVIDI